MSRRKLLGTVAVLGAGLVTGRVRAESKANALEKAARAELQNFAAWADKERARLGVCVVEVASGREIAAFSAREALNPASNQKLLTIACALDLLGPAHRFSTSLHGTSSEHGLTELVLRGTGDPELSTTDLDGLARSVVNQGFRRLDGDLLVDQSAFDSLWDPPGYEQRPNDWAAYRAPVSAVAIDRNTVRLHVVPTTENGPAKVWFEPPGLVDLSGSITTVAKGDTPTIGFSVAPKAGRMAAKISGNVPIDRRELSFSRRLAAPELAPGHALARLLSLRSIFFSGSVKRGSSDGAPLLARSFSRPLGEIVPALGKASDNFVAEMLLKALGAKRTGRPGSSKDGALALVAHLERLGALDPGTRILNGSGLYDANRLSAFSIARVLRAAHADPRIGPELLASLAIGGVDGTLVSRFRGLRKDRTIRAKTGTLSSVVALSGYILRASPESPLAFSILLNAVGGKLVEARRRIDRFVELLAATA